MKCNAIGSLLKVVIMLDNLSPSHRGRGSTARRTAVACVLVRAVAIVRSRRCTKDINFPPQSLSRLS